MTYLDWAATALPDPQVIEAYARAAVEYSGNPSSPYPAGKAARSALEDARARSAAVLGCRSEQLAFTSGGTEANAIVLLSKLLLREPGTLLVSGLEHPSVAETAAILGSQGWKLKEIPPDPDGRISSGKITKALEQNPDIRLVAVMGVNNETGAIQPLPELIAAVRSFQTEKTNGRPIHFHADLVQAAGKIPVNLGKLDVDTASFSAHKFRGPRGIGLLYHRNPKFEAFIRGGGQEHGVRPGTENTAGAVAIALALELHGSPPPEVQENGAWLLKELITRPGLAGKAKIVPEIRGQLTSAEVAADASQNYAPGIIAVSFPPIPGEVLARVLAESGYSVSTGSACSNNKKGKLPKAMLAMKVPKTIATGMIRISIGGITTREELEEFLVVLERNIEILTPFIFS